MTALADRPHMLLDAFEEPARLAARTAEGVRLEFRPTAKAAPA
ncbi:hypothetical protein [Streptomyces pinistramenti]|nr:hypothetical protein [Streptomyces pinistramenti]